MSLLPLHAGHQSGTEAAAMVPDHRYLLRSRLCPLSRESTPTNLSPSFDLSAASTPADGESDEIDVRPPRNDPLIVKTVNVRPGEVEVETDRLLVKGRHEIEEPTAEAHGGR